MYLHHSQRSEIDFATNLVVATMDKNSMKRIAKCAVLNVTED